MPNPKKTPIAKKHVFPAKNKYRRLKRIAVNVVEMNNVPFFGILLLFSFYFYLSPFFPFF